jgi:hypothetical protein
MKRNGLLILLLLAATLALAAAPGMSKLARLKVWNRTGENVYIKLTTDEDNGSLYYYFVVDDGEHVYTVERATYDIVYKTCGQSTRGVIELHTQRPLTFTSCKRQNLWYADQQRWQAHIQK